MARDRILPSDFWTTEAVIDCAMMSRLLLIGLWNFADDFGVQPLRPRTIRMQVFPGDAIDNDAVLMMIEELAAHDLVRIYQVDGMEYLAVVDWEQFQRVGKRARRRYPPAEPSSSTMANQSNGESGTAGEAREQPSPTSANQSNAETPRSPPFGEPGARPSRTIANQSNGRAEPHLPFETPASRAPQAEAGVGC
jgi:hypothetical protein